MTTLITKINHCRKNQKALQQTNNIQFLSIDNDQILAYYKYDQQKENEVICIVNLDPYHSQKGMLQLPLQEMGVHAGHPIKVRDLITQSSYIWDKEWNYVELHPVLPFHLFNIEK